jgi:hypothetical protein
MPKTTETQTSRSAIVSCRTRSGLLRGGCWPGMKLWVSGNFWCVGRRLRALLTTAKSQECGKIGNQFGVSPTYRNYCQPATGTTPDPLLANGRQGIHQGPSPQVNVPARPFASASIWACCASVLYAPAWLGNRSWRYHPSDCLTRDLGDEVALAELCQAADRHPIQAHDPGAQILHVTWQDTAAAPPRRRPWRSALPPASEVIAMTIEPSRTTGSTAAWTTAPLVVLDLEGSGAQDRDSEAIHRGRSQHRSGLAAVAPPPSRHRPRRHR